MTVSAAGKIKNADSGAERVQELKKFMFNDYAGLTAEKAKNEKDLAKKGEKAAKVIEEKRQRSYAESQAREKAALLKQAVTKAEKNAAAASARAEKSAARAETSGKPGDERYAAKKAAQAQQRTDELQAARKNAAKADKTLEKTSKSLEKVQNKLSNKKETGVMDKYFKEEAHKDRIDEVMYK